MWNSERVLAAFDAGIATVIALYNLHYESLARVAREASDLRIAHHAAMAHTIFTLNDMEFAIAEPGYCRYGLSEGGPCGSPTHSNSTLCEFHADVEGAVEFLVAAIDEVGGLNGPVH